MKAFRTKSRTCKWWIQEGLKPSTRIYKQFSKPEGSHSIFHYTCHLSRGSKFTDDANFYSIYIYIYYIYIYTYLYSNIKGRTSTTIPKLESSTKEGATGQPRTSGFSWNSTFTYSTVGCYGSRGVKKNPRYPSNKYGFVKSGDEPILAFWNAYAGWSPMSLVQCSQSWYYHFRCCSIRFTSTHLLIANLWYHPKNILSGISKPFLHLYGQTSLNIKVFQPFTKLGFLVS